MMFQKFMQDPTSPMVVVLVLAIMVYCGLGLHTVYKNRAHKRRMDERDAEGQRRLAAEEEARKLREFFNQRARNNVPEPENELPYSIPRTGYQTAPPPAKPVHYKPLDKYGNEMNRKRDDDHVPAPAPVMYETPRPVVQHHEISQSHSHADHHGGSSRSYDHSHASHHSSHSHDSGGSSGDSGGGGGGSCGGGD